MDYGHTNTEKEQPFFTDGAGTNDTMRNNDEPEDNLDLSSKGAAKWSEIHTAPTRDPRVVGGGVIGTLSEIKNTSADSIKNPELGRIVEAQEDIHDQSQNHGNQTTNKEPQTAVEKAGIDNHSSIDLSLVRAEKDIISPKTLEATEHIVDEFKKGAIGPAELEAEKNRLMEAYLGNSFGRKLAA